jgi:hypothetical protein
VPVAAPSGPGPALPPGYRSLKPLEARVEGKLGIPEPRRYRFAAGLNAIHLGASELIAAARHYPVAFAADRTGILCPVAITGFEPGRNRFVSTRGEWRESAYVPAYVRRYPFYPMAARGPGGRAVVGVDPAGLSARAPALFDHRGEPTAAWRGVEALVNEMEGDRGPTEALCARLREADLLEPFQAEAHPNAGPPRRVIGLERVSEERLNRLAAERIRGFMERGELSRIYAHLMSLDNFAALLEGDPGDC